MKALASRATSLKKWDIAIENLKGFLGLSNIKSIQLQLIIITSITSIFFNKNKRHY
jgi:hypothetical protein